MGQGKAGTTEREGPGLVQERDAWVETTLAALDRPARLGQMLVARAHGLPQHPESAPWRELHRQVRELGLGGIVLFRSELGSIEPLLESLDAEAAVPLLVGADLERSLSFRIEEGTTPVPTAMALGATRDLEAARWVGELTGREARAAGIPWVLAPVADVNDDPRNPVIHLRSFGERPELVAAMVRAFVQGVEEAGALATVKHFPGHGTTTVDSHEALPRIEKDRETLERIDLRPFREAIEAGVSSVMVGHLSVPALDSSGTPATLSRPILEELLRGELRFEGLVATDAMEMKGVGGRFMGRAVVEAVRAGADLILLPADLRVAHQALLEAVAEGALTDARIEDSVRRILRAKWKAGLARPDSERRRERREGRSLIGHPADIERAGRLFDGAWTVVRDREGLLPLRLENTPTVLLLEPMGPATGLEAATALLAEELRRRGLPIERLRLPEDPRPERWEELRARAREREVRMVVLAPRAAPTSGSPLLSPSQREFLEGLEAGGLPLIVLSLSSPYALQEVPWASTLATTYGAAPRALEAAAAGLLGLFPWRGRLPVSVPGVARSGEGLERPARRLELESSPPHLVGFPAEGLSEVDRVIEEALAERAFPGAVVAVGRRGRLVHLEAYGRMTYDPGAPAVRVDTIFDLASLTKVMATTTAAMLLVDEGRIGLDLPVAEYLPCFAGEGWEHVTVRHLLAHHAGLEAWAPLHLELSGREGLRSWLCRQRPVDRPGTVVRYSDLGFLILGEVLEVAAGEPLEAFLRRRLFEPLGFVWTGWNPSEALRPRIAPTEFDSVWRKRLVHGEVHDENAAALGGVAPHAGLFGTAEELARFAQMMLWKGVYGGRRIVRKETVELFTRRDGSVPDSSRALGWDTKSPSGSSAGSRFSSSSFGHTGFTGTSLWIDPERELFLILLSNRVHPTRENRKIQAVRARLADAVIEALERGERADTDPPGVQTGLDRLAAGESWGLEGKRLGLLSHPAAATRQGTPALDVLRSRGLQVVRLLAAEHGWSGRAAAGEPIAHGEDPDSRLPIVSLYSPDSAALSEALRGLDTVVVDLQDVGVRFYTYAATVLELLEAAGKAGVEVVVLDRPNPLGGDRILGPERDPVEEVPVRLVNRLPGPLVHGMTLGELVRYANAGFGVPARLRVVPMSGWRRRFRWNDLGRPWIPPSPNLKTFEAALVYPGVAWLEATNVSEGRGTETPFLLWGAPWLGGGPAELEVPGLRFHPVEFVPESRPEAPVPKYRGQVCRGFRIEVQDPRAVDPLALGRELLRYLARQPGFELLEGGRALERLIGIREAAHRLLEEGGISDPGRSSYLRAREPFLLYPQ